MKQKLLSRAAMLCTAIIAIAATLSSCNNETNGLDDSETIKATVPGVVIDTFDSPVSDVTVSCRGTDANHEVIKSATTAEDGTFSIADVPSTACYITFEKTGFATVAYTIDPKRFETEDEIVLSPTLEFSQATIEGVVLNVAGNGYAGVTVSNGATTVTTDEEGKFLIGELTIKDYTLTYTAPDGGGTYTTEVKIADFVDGCANIPPVRLGNEFIFPTLSWQDLAESPEWFANEYHGAAGNFGTQKDWTTGYLSAQPTKGHFRYEAEGCAFFPNIPGEPGEETGENGLTYQGDFDNLNSFFYGRKHIYEGNKILSVWLRTHGATAEDPAYFGLQVLDLTAGAIKAVKVGDTKTHGSGDYATYSFDLSDYVGHEIAFAFGVYFDTGTFGKHLPIRRMCFAPAAVDADADLGGTFVTGIPNSWKMTVENASSMGINPLVEFTGLPLGQTQDDIKVTHNPNGHQGYTKWSGTNHLMMYWSYMYIKMNAEPWVNEGYVIKTDKVSECDYETPDTYIYSRFNISAANDKLSMRVRTFNTTKYPTNFKFTVIDDQGNATVLDPVAYPESASKVTDGEGCWKFVHESGNANTPDAYAVFSYDLSAYTGKNIVIAISIHKGPDATERHQKLGFHSIVME